MTTLTPRVFSRIAGLAAALAVAATSVHAQQSSRWHPGLALGGFVHTRNGADGTANATLSSRGLQATVFADRWLSPSTGVRVEANSMLVVSHTEPLLCVVGPGPGFAPCPQPGGELSVGGLELTLLDSPSGSAGRGATVEIGLGVYRTFHRPVGIIDPTTHLINVAGAHVGWSLPLAGPVRLNLRVQSLSGGVLTFAAGGGLGIVF